MATHFAQPGRWSPLSKPPKPQGGPSSPPAPLPTRHRPLTSGDTQVFIEGKIHPLPTRKRSCSPPAHTPFPFPLKFLPLRKGNSHKEMQTHTAPHVYVHCPETIPWVLLSPVQSQPAYLGVAGAGSQARSPPPGSLKAALCLLLPPASLSPASASDVIAWRGGLMLTSWFGGLTLSGFQGVQQG